MKIKQKSLFVAIILAAIFFRFFLITQMPGGLFPDEAANGLDINSMQQGQLQPFYERGNGREALFFYMLWGSVELFGKGAWQHHGVSALVGLLAVILCYFVTYRLFMIGKEKTDEAAKNRAINIALLAMFLMAVSSWHVVLSRTAFRANLIPLFTSLTIFFLLAAFQSVTTKTRLWYSFLSGAALALGFYTYIAYRVLIPILGVAIFWPLASTLWTRTFTSQIKKYFWPAVFSIVAFIIFIYPIAKYFYDHPGSFIGRSGQVSIFNPELYTIDGQQYHGKPDFKTVVLPVLGEVTKKSLLGYVTVGDLNWRHNVSGQPFLSALVSPFFVIGLLLSLFYAVVYMLMPNKKSHLWKFFLLTGWFWGMLLPVVTTAEGIPHGLRSIGTIPVVFIITAWFLYAVSEKVYAWHTHIWQKCWCGDTSLSVNHSPSDHPTPRFFTTFRKNIVEWALKILVVCFGFALIAQTFVLYFIYAFNSPENFYAFRSDLTVVARYLTSHCENVLSATGVSSKNSTYLILDKFSVQTTDYTTSDPKGHFERPCNVPYMQVDPENSWELKNLQSGDQIVFTQSSIFDIKKFKQYHPKAQLHLEHRNKFGQAVMAVYVIKD